MKQFMTLPFLMPGFDHRFPDTREKFPLAVRREFVAKQLRILRNHQPESTGRGSTARFPDYLPDYAGI